MVAQNNVLLSRPAVDTDVVGPSWEHFVFIQRMLVQRLMWTPRQIHPRFARRHEAMWDVVSPGAHRLSHA